MPPGRIAIANSFSSLGANSVIRSTLPSSQSFYEPFLFFACPRLFGAEVNNQSNQRVPYQDLMHFLFWKNDRRPVSASRVVTRSKAMTRTPLINNVVQAQREKRPNITLLNVMNVLRSPSKGNTGPDRLQCARAVQRLQVRGSHSRGGGPYLAYAGERDATSSIHDGHGSRHMTYTARRLVFP